MIQISSLSTMRMRVGDTVLVNREGNGARQMLELPGGSIISVIVGIVDSVKIEG